MSKLVEKILREGLLNESKNIGILYHFTSFENIIPILKSNSIFSFERQLNNKIINVVSTTRDKILTTNSFMNINGTDVRIALNGNKISENYRIMPYNDFAEVHNVARPVDETESEEMIITSAEGLKNIKNFILGITLFIMKDDDIEERRKVKDLATKIKKTGIVSNIELI